MSTLDLHNNMLYTGGLFPKAAVADDTAFVSAIIDTANMSATEFVIIHGANTDADASYTVLVEDGDNSALTDNVAVADANLLGTEGAISGTGNFDFSDDNAVLKIGYIGPKRYVRVTITPADNTGGTAFIAGVWVQTGRKHQTAQKV